MSLAELVVLSVKVEGRSKSEVARDYRMTRYWVLQLVYRGPTRVPRDACVTTEREPCRVASSDVLAAVSTTLVERLKAGVSDLSNPPPKVDLNDLENTPPKDPPLVTLFLYDIVEEASLRNRARPARWWAAGSSSASSRSGCACTTSSPPGAATGVPSRRSWAG